MTVTDQPFTAVVSAAGTAVVTFKPPTSRNNYIVQQVSVEYATAPASCVCTLRKNGRFITYIIPTGDSAGGDPPVPLSGGSDSMTVTFTGATPGQIVNVFFIYDDGTRS
jgi:hypothetical protein